MSDTGPETPDDRPLDAAQDAAALVGEIFDEAAAETDCALAVPSLREAYAEGGTRWRPETLIGLIAAATRGTGEAETS